jgi:hypothetical protein
LEYAEVRRSWSAKLINFRINLAVRKRDIEWSSLEQTDDIKSAMSGALAGLIF